MRIKSQDDILDVNVRKKIIEEMIYGDENLQRKLCELRKHEIYRDLNAKWVMEGIKREGYKPTTVQQMANRASNISVCRKIVDKKAITYAGSIERIVEDASSQESIDALTRELDFNTKMKKADKYRELFRNALSYTVPVISNRFSSGADLKYEICNKILAPWEYDVVEDCYDPTKILALIVTSFPEQNKYVYDSFYTSDLAGNRSLLQQYGLTSWGDNRDQLIADAPGDKDADNNDRQFIWWTDSYHFTTNAEGEIIATPYSGNDVTAIQNPIGILPAVNIAQNQDGAFWSKGGNDISDGSIWINKMLTDVAFLAYVQGWGQMVISAANIPKALVGGPDNAFIFEVKEGEPTPNVTFASSNPPLESWLETIRSYVAMLLSTNNLSSSAVTTRLDVATAQSGVAKMIENAELTTDIQDQQQLFKDAEPLIWDVIKRWHMVYASANSLIPNQQDIPIFKDSDVKVKFNQLMPPMSEKEKLEAMKMKKDLGIVTTEDLLQAEHPDLTDEQIKEKLSKLGDANAEETQKTEETQMAQGDEGVLNGEESGVPVGS